MGFSCVLYRICEQRYWYASCNAAAAFCFLVIEFMCFGLKGVAGRSQPLVQWKG